jgi:hypothetical protein
MATSGIHVQPTFISGVSLVPDYSSNPFISGYEMVIKNPGSVWQQGGTIVSLKPGSARAFNSQFIITFNPYLISSPSPTLDIDITKLGALGCYPRPLSDFVLGLQINTFNVYVLGDSSGINPTTAIICTGNNFLLPGYDKWRKVATAIINGSFNQLYQITQTGSGIERDYVSLQFFSGSGYGPTTFFPIPYGNGSSPFYTHILMRRSFAAASVTDFAAVSQYNFGTIDKLSYIIQSPATSGDSSAVLQDEVWIPFGKDENGSNVLYLTVFGAGSSLGIFNCGWREYNGLQAL